MSFLLRLAFWFSLVLLVIPFDFGGEDEAGRVGPLATFLAARAALTDLSGLCERRPDVCEVGRSAMNTVGRRAREAARIAYQLLDENFENKPEAADDAAVPGGIGRTAGTAETVGPATPSKP